MASTGKAPQSSSSEAPSLLPPRASSSMVQEGASAKRERLQDAEAASDAKQRKCRRLETVGTGGNVEKRGLSSEDDQYYDPSTDEEERKGWDSLEDVVSRYYSSYMSPVRRFYFSRGGDATAIRRFCASPVTNLRADPNRAQGKRETNKIDYTGLDQYVHLHNNRVAVVGLAPTHPAIAEKKTVQSIVWNARAKQGTLDMSGKKKKGYA